MAQTRLIRVAELAVQRGCCAAEDVCLLAAASPELLVQFSCDELWQQIVMLSHHRPLPAMCAEENQSQEAGSVKAKFLARYVSVLAVRKRVRSLWRRVSAVWSAMAPESVGSLRPGLKEKEIDALERELHATAQLPEDFAESLRCHDGHDHECGCWHFADAHHNQPAFRVLRLLPMHEMLIWLRDGSQAFAELLDEGHMAHLRPVTAWLPIAITNDTFLWRDVSPEQARFRLLRVEQITSQPEIGFGEVHRGPLPCSYKAASCFVDYLADYVRFLEGVQTQATEEGWDSPGDIFRGLFSGEDVQCEAQGNWITTGFGKGKGNLWKWVGGTGAIRVIKTSPGKMGRRLGRYKG